MALKERKKETNMEAHLRCCLNEYVSYPLRLMNEVFAPWPLR